MNNITTFEQQCIDAARHDDTQELNMLANGEKGLHMATWTTAARMGNSRILKWGVEKGLLKHQRLLKEVVKAGNLNVLRVMNEELGVRNGYTAFRAAVKNGHIHILKYMHERGDDFLPAEGYELEELLNSHLDGPHPYVNFFARKPVTVDTIKYVIETMNVPYGPYTRSVFLDSKRHDLVEYLDSIGCPRDEEMENTPLSKRRTHDKIPPSMTYL